LSPKELDLRDWKFLDEEKNLIELRCLIDVNGDKKFDSDDKQ